MSVLNGVKINNILYLNLIVLISKLHEGYLYNKICIKIWVFIVNFRVQIILLFIFFLLCKIFILYYILYESYNFLCYNIMLFIDAQIYIKIEEITIKNEIIISTLLNLILS